MSLFQEQKVGDPWSVLPIKNAKQARDCIEMHLGNRGCHRIINFEHFPNLQVVWLNKNKVTCWVELNNNNQLKNLDGLEDVFRIKQVYCQDNMIQNLNGIKKLKFLDALLASNNKLKDLERTLNYLQRFAFLQQLDLFGNPVAEEPQYRLRVISALPQLKIFDRHRMQRFQYSITPEQKIKAQKIELRNSGPLPPHLQKAKKKVSKPKEEFSKGEKDLYRDVKTIKAKTLRIKKEQEDRLFREVNNYFSFKSHPVNQTEIHFHVPQEPPLATAVIQNQAQFCNYNESSISTWQKNVVKKLFQAYDKDKSSFLSIEEFRKLFQDLSADKGFLGKIPLVQKNKIDELFENWDKSKDDKLSWIEFREGMNDKFLWQHLSKESIDARCQQLFKAAYKQKMMGNDKKSQQIARNALSLQGSITRDIPMQVFYLINLSIISIKKQQKIVERKIKRGDVFDLKFAQRSSELKKQTCIMKKDY